MKKGCLTLDDSHLNGRVHLLIFTNDGTIEYYGEIEGWEYLTSPYNGFNIESLRS